MKKILTIVVPTYNMEKYLDKCLTSLILPDEQMQMLEVLVINDGSKDRSSEIAHGYEAKYPQTFKVIDKENGNYGSCVNRGLKAAAGVYIKVLDADDNFNTEYLSSFIDFLSANRVDMVVSDVIRVDSNQNIIANIKYNLIRDRIITFSEIGNNVNFEMHALTYRTSVLRDMDYVQTEGISYTDTEWATLPMRYVKTIMYFNKPLYLYLVGRDGQTIDPIVMAKGYKQLITIFRRIIPILYGQTDYEAYQYIDTKIFSSLVYLYSTVLRHHIETDTAELKEFDSWLHSNYRNLYEKTNSIKPHRLVPYYYVSNWRMHKCNKYPSPFYFFIARYARKFFH